MVFIEAFAPQLVFPSPPFDPWKKKSLKIRCFCFLPTPLPCSWYDLAECRLAFTTTYEKLNKTRVLFAERESSLLDRISVGGISSLSFRVSVLGSFDPTRPLVDDGFSRLFRSSLVSCCWENLANRGSVFCFYSRSRNSLTIFFLGMLGMGGAIERAWKISQVLVMDKKISGAKK